MRTAVLLGSLVVGCGCSNKAQTELYDWHPALKPHGLTAALLSSLPLGVLSRTEEVPNEGGFIEVAFSTQDASDLLTTQADAVVAATAWYLDSPRQRLLSMAYAALVPKGKEPNIEKKNRYLLSTINPLRPRAAYDADLLSFRSQLISGLLDPTDDCRLYYLHSEEEHDFVVLTGRRQNLYLEIAICGKLPGMAPDFAAMEREYDREYERLMNIMSSPDATEAEFAAAMKKQDSLPMPWIEFWDSDSELPAVESPSSWEHPILKRLRAAHDATNLKICRFLAGP